MAEIGAEATLPFDRAAVAAAAFGDLAGVADRRTLAILEHRRRSQSHRRGWLVRRLLLAADVVALVAAFVAVELVFGAGAGAANDATSGQETLLLLATLPVWIVIAKLYGLYDQDEERTHHSTADDFSASSTSSPWGSGSSMPGRGRSTWPTRSWRSCSLSGPSRSPSITVARACARAIGRRNIAYLQNTIIVGAGDVGQLIARKLLHHPEYGINLVGFVDVAAEGRAGRPRPPRAARAARAASPTLVELLDVERVIVAFSNDSPEEHARARARHRATLDVQIDIVPRLFELVGPSVAGPHARGAAARRAAAAAALAARRVAIKRAIDVVGRRRRAGPAPHRCSPSSRGAIRRDSPGPVFFRQTRLGHEPGRVHGAEVPDDADGRRHGGAPRVHPRRRWTAARAPTANGLYKLERRTRSRRSAAGCARRASTSCRS